MSDIKRERSDKTGFSSPFLPDDLRSSEIKTRLFRELQERFSIEIPKPDAPDYDDTRLQQHFEYLEQEVEYLLSLRPPEEDEEIENAVIYVNLEFNTDIGKDGSSWELAYKSIDRAFQKYRDLFIQDQSPRQIWIANGGKDEDGVQSVTPTVMSGFANIKDSSNTSYVTEDIELVFPGMRVYGGFTGGETSISQRTGRTQCRRNIAFRNITEPGEENRNYFIYGGVTVGRPDWEDIEEFSQWGNNPIVVDGFLFDFDDFADRSEQNSFIHDVYGTEKAVISNCEFIYGQSEIVSRNADTQIILISNYLSQYRVINLSGYQTISNCRFKGYNIDWEIIRDFSNSNQIAGYQFRVDTMIMAENSTFRSCSFEDFILSLTGISGDNAIGDATNGSDATFFDIEPIVQADKILTCTFTNVSITHNAYDCDGGNGSDAIDTPYPSNVGADEFQSPFWTSGPDDAIRTFTAAPGTTRGGGGGNSQYGQAGNGGNGSKGAPSLRLLESSTQDGAIEYSTPTTEYELHSDILYIQNTSNGNDGGDGGDSGRVVSDKGSHGSIGSGAEGRPGQLDEDLSGYTFVDELSNPRSAPTYLTNTSEDGEDGEDGEVLEYDVESDPFIDFEEHWEYYANTFVPAP